MNQESDPLDDLLLRAKSSDRTALERLCHEVQVRLRPILEFRLRGWSRQDKEDILQSTLMTFCEKLDIVADNPVRFALVILRNKIGNEYQSARRRREVALVSEDTDESRGPTAVTIADASLSLQTGSIAEELVRRERAEQIVAAIRKLTEFCHEALIALLQGYTVMEVWDRAESREPGLKRGAFDKRLFDCKKKLKGLLGGIERD